MSVNDPANPLNLTPDDQPVPEEATFEVDGLHDPAVVRRVEASLRAVEGVIRVETHLDQSRIQVQYDARRTNVPSLHDALASTGYRPARWADDL